MKRVFLAPLSMAAMVLVACTPEPGAPDADSGSASDVEEDLASQTPDPAGDDGQDDGDAAQAVADDFLNSAEIGAYEAGERGRLSMNSLAGALAGESFYVSFDNCPYDDTGWQEGNDPLAGIRCGYRYYASLNSDGDLAFTGPLEPFGSIFTAPGSISQDGVTVWGVPFGVRMNGTIVDGSDNEVGYIGLGEAP